MDNYNGLIERISETFIWKLEGMRAIYNFDIGDEFEIAVCEVLRSILPAKYGICRGFVVNIKGETAGDDIIIYDHEVSPTLRFLDKGKFDRKEQIPVEAVYAYIEAKNTLDEKTLEKAIEQVQKVKKLCYTRILNPIIPIEDSIGIFDNEYSKHNGYDPIISNPVYSMIISCNCVDINGLKTSRGKSAQEFLVNQINNNCSNLDKGGFYNADSIIAGNICTAFCGHYLYEKAENGQMIQGGIQITRFYTGMRPKACYQVNESETTAYGKGISHLMLALDYIKLGTMPWDLIFNSSKVPDEDERNRLQALILHNEEN